MSTVTHQPGLFTSAAATAMKDPVICVGREELHLELLCALAVSRLCFHFTHTHTHSQCRSVEGKAGLLAAYTVCLHTVCARTCTHVGVGDAVQAAA